MVNVNGIPYVNGKLYDWADIVVTIAGVPVTGITGIEYKDEQEMEAKYGAGPGDGENPPAFDGGRAGPL